MSATLRQKGFFYTNYFEIKESGVLIKTRRWFLSQEYFLSFETIGMKIFRKKGSDTMLFFIAAGIYMLSCFLYFYELKGGETENNAWVFYFFIASIVLLIAVFTFKKVFYLTNTDRTNAIEFLSDKPNIDSINIFINELTINRKKYLENKYCILSKHLPYIQQYNNLQWMLENDALTKEEYESKVSELNLIFEPENPVIGFQYGVN